MPSAYTLPPKRAYICDLADAAIRSNALVFTSISETEPRTLPISPHFFDQLGTEWNEEPSESRPWLYAIDDRGNMIIAPEQQPFNGVIDFKMCHGSLFTFYYFACTTRFFFRFPFSFPSLLPSLFLPVPLFLLSFLLSFRSALVIRVHGFMLARGNALMTSRVLYL